ncbi:hypothetical protein CP556_25140 [Natrinema sp. CBA1119]|nr:hypothetical protein CP556_25140 [Natrinema sp. CBA1119]
MSLFEFSEETVFDENGDKVGQEENEPRTDGGYRDQAERSRSCPRTLRPPEPVPIKSVLQEMDLENPQDETAPVSVKEIGDSVIFLLSVPREQAADMGIPDSRTSHTLCRRVGDEGLLIKRLHTWRENF